LLLQVMSDDLSDAIVAAGLANGDHAGITAHLISAASHSDSSLPFSSARRAYSRTLVPSLTSMFEERAAFEPLLSHREPTLPQSANQSDSLALEALCTLLLASGDAPGLARLTPDVLSAMAAFASALDAEAPLALFDEWYNIPRVVGGELVAFDATASHSKPGCPIAPVFGRDRSFHDVWRSGALPDSVLSASTTHDSVSVSFSVTPRSLATLRGSVTESRDFFTLHLKFPDRAVIPRYVTVSAAASTAGPFTELSAVDMASPPDDASWMRNVGVVQQCGLVLDVPLPAALLACDALHVRTALAGRLSPDTPVTDDVSVTRFVKPVFV
jgi:hypothetical protein